MPPKIHSTTWKTDSPLTGEAMAQSRSGLLAEPELMEKTGSPLTPEGSKVLGAGTPVCGRPRPQPQSLLPSQEPKAYSSLACFSLQYKEDGRLSFSPGLEQGRIQFLYLPTSLLYTKNGLQTPAQKRPQKHNSQAHLTLPVLSRPLGQWHYNTKLWSASVPKQESEPWPQAEPVTHHISFQMFSARDYTYMSHSSRAYRPCSESCGSKLSSPH